MIPSPCASRCTRSHSAPVSLRSAIVAPLAVRDRRIGALVALYDRPGRVRLEESRVVAEAVRDAQGQMGPYEAALTSNHPLVDPERPIEILRTIHSFDPCMACGVHVLDATGKVITEVKVQ